MRSVYEQRVAEARETERTIAQGNARLCSPKFGIAWKALYPFKSAEELAARVGCSVRAAAYEISGERHPCAQSIQALINEVTPRYRA